MVDLVGRLHCKFDATGTISFTCAHPLHNSHTLLVLEVYARYHGNREGITRLVIGRHVINCGKGGGMGKES